MQTMCIMNVGESCRVRPAYLSDVRDRKLTMGTYTAAQSYCSSGRNQPDRLRSLSVDFGPFSTDGGQRRPAQAFDGLSQVMMIMRGMHP